MAERTSATQATTQVNTEINNNQPIIIGAQWKEAFTKRFVNIEMTGEVVD